MQQGLSAALEAGPERGLDSETEVRATRMSAEAEGGEQQQEQDALDSQLQDVASLNQARSLAKRGWIRFRTITRVVSRAGRLIARVGGRALRKGKNNGGQIMDMVEEVAGGEQDQGGEEEQTKEYPSYYTDDYDNEVPVVIEYDESDPDPTPVEYE